MASYRKRGDKWIAEIRRKDFSKSKTWPTKALAKTWASKVEAELDLLRTGRINTIKTFGDAVARYIEEVSPTKRSERWESIRYEALKRFDIWNVLMSNITPQHIADYRDLRLSKVSSATVIRELGFISAIFAVALKEWNWIHYNPVSLITKPKKPKPRTRRITEDEITAIVSALHYKEGAPVTLKMHQVAVLFLLAIETAMRTKEMITLQWSNVHSDKKYVQLDITKNSDARSVPLSKRAIQILGWMGGINKKRVFTISESVSDALFRKAKKKLKIEDLHFHDTRREATSRLAKKLDVMDLAKMTGHRDLKMLLNVYYKPVPSEIADLLD